MDKNINNNGFEYVDLGLPSGTLWATMNVGASKPSDYGQYFQWGDTQGYTAAQIGKDKQFNWNNYKWGSTINFTKYTNIGETLDLEDDAAHAKMGGDWHIPTPEQFQELLDNTTSEWATLDDVDGILFTSEKDTSKSVFIPAAGYTWDGSVLDSGDYGYVLSSMLSMGNVNYGQGFYFCPNNICLDYGYRYYGFSVRGVIDGPKDTKRNMEAKEGRTIEGIINRMKNNFKVKIKKEDAGYVVVELLYKGEVIDSDWCIDTDLNPLSE